MPTPTATDQPAFDGHGQRSRHGGDGDQQDIEVLIRLDVGKSDHHAVALNRAGKKLFDKALPNDETRLRKILDGLSEHGKILLVVDQPATIGALPVAVAQAAGATVGYLPGLAMRRIADLYPGQAKTDARDAMIIAETARTMPHMLRSIALDDETLVRARAALRLRRRPRRADHLDIQSDTQSAHPDPPGS
jgi:hypothetical protein